LFAWLPYPSAIRHTNAGTTAVLRWAAGGRPVTVPAMTTLLTAAEQAAAEALPQLDASSLINEPRLEAAITDMYRRVADGEGDGLHFAIGRALAEQLGYSAELLDRIPAAAAASFAGVGCPIALTDIEPGMSVLDLGSGAGTDVFCAAALVGAAGRTVGVDITGAQLDKARALSRGWTHVEFVEARIEQLPFADASFDVVLSNGVVNLSPRKDRVFAEVARVLRQGGRLAIADIVSERALRERTRRNVELWAACIAGAVPSTAYLQAASAAGLEVIATSENPYRFVTDGAIAAGARYGVRSMSLVARKA
jgi:arsenite methyltransferase